MAPLLGLLPVLDSSLLFFLTLIVARRLFFLVPLSIFGLIRPFSLLWFFLNYFFPLFLLSFLPLFDFIRFLFPSVFLLFSMPVFTVLLRICLYFCCFSLSFYLVLMPLPSQRNEQKMSSDIEVFETLHCCFMCYALLLLFSLTRRITKMMIIMIFTMISITKVITNDLDDDNISMFISNKAITLFIHYYCR